jgi:predicted dehydrogenase
MLAAARRNRVKLCTNHNYRYKPSVRRASRLVAGGDIGQVVHVDSYYGLSDERGDFEGAGAGHWAQRLPGGIFTNFLPHLIYLQMSFLDMRDDDSVTGVALGHGNGREEPATELSVLLQGDGATGTMTFSTLARPYAKFLDIYGTRGIVHCDLVREVCTVYRDRHLPRLIGKALFNVEASAQLASGTVVNTAKVALGRMKNMPELPVIFDEFYASIRLDREPPASGEEGRRMIGVMEQVWRKAPSLTPTPAPTGTTPAHQPRPGPTTQVEQGSIRTARWPGKCS